MARQYNKENSGVSNETKPNKKRSENVSRVKKIDKVKVSIPNLNIRKGPGFDHDRTGEFTGIGEFELLERKDGRMGQIKIWKRMDLPQVL